MPRANGVYTLPPSYLATTGQTILASQHNPPLEDMAQAITGSLPRDGSAPMLANLPLNGYKVTGAAAGVNQDEYVTLAQLEEAISQVKGFFPGFMQVDTVTSTAAPSGWLYANGQSVSRTTFAALWTRVQGGNNLASTQADKTAGQYGPGDGSTTFTLPNLYADNGYFIRPISTGRVIGSVQADDLKSHQHTLVMNAVDPHTHDYQDFEVSGAVTPDVGSGGAYGRRTLNKTTSPAGGFTPSGTVQATGGAETRPKNIAYPVLIKT